MSGERLPRMEPKRQRAHANEHRRGKPHQHGAADFDFFANEHSHGNAYRHAVAHGSGDRYPFGYPGHSLPHPSGHG